MMRSKYKPMCESICCLTLWLSENYIILSKEQRQKIQSANSLKALYQAIQKPFFVIPPIQSSLNTSSYLNGTRISLNKASIDTYDFSICSASTSDRMFLYEHELHYVFEFLVEALHDFMTFQQHKEPVSELDDRMYINEHQKRQDDVLRLGLKLFYYWVNYAPITRGSSATGYVLLYSISLATGFEFVNSVPEGVQLDWEAMFSSTPEIFIDKVWSWISPRRVSPLYSNYLSTSTLHDFQHRSQKCDVEGRRLRTLFPTINSMLYGLVHPFPKTQE